MGDLHRRRVQRAATVVTATSLHPADGGRTLLANDVRGDLQGQFARVWRAVARHYRDNPDVIGYEIYNEPRTSRSPTSIPSSNAITAARRTSPIVPASGVQALRDGLIGAIQSADPDHVVFYEPVVHRLRQRETIGIAEPPRFPPRRARVPHVRRSGQQLPLIARERAATDTLQAGGPPLIMDEFGASNYNALTATTVDAAGADDLSWSYWSGLQLHDPTGNPDEALLDQRTRRPSPGKARALAVPYAWATAGVPGSESFAGGVFSYAYTVARAISAPTLIEVPRLAYQDGYRVRVRGAIAISTADARLLELRASPQARDVRLTVTPGASGSIGNGLPEWRGPSGPAFRVKRFREH